MSPPTARSAPRRSAALVDGKVTHLAPPEYHGNPIDDAGSLVTFHYGHDLPQLIREWAPGFDVGVTRFNDRRQSIVGEFTA